MRKSLHNNNTRQQLDPSKQPQYQHHAPSVNVRGRGATSSSSGLSPFSRQIDHISPSLKRQDQATGNRNINSYSHALRRDSSEYDLPQSDNSSSKVKRVVSKGNETHKSSNDGICESESRSTDDDCSSIDDDHASLTPNSENDNQPKRSHTQRQRKLVSPEIEHGAADNDDEVVESRFANKRITSACTSRTYGTNSQYSTSSHRKNGDAFSSSSNGTSSEEEDNDIPMVKGPLISNARHVQRYPRNNTNDSGSFTANDDKVNNIQSSSSAPSHQLHPPRDNKFTIMLKQRKLARDAGGTGHVSTLAAGSAFDQALEQVKTSSNISTDASSSFSMPAKAGVHAISKALGPSHSTRRNETGAVIGSFHLPHPDSPSFSTPKSMDHKERGSTNVRERESTVEGNLNLKKTSVSIISSADEKVIKDTFKLEESNSAVDSVQAKITEKESFDDISLKPNIIPKNDQSQSFPARQALPVQDSVKADQKLSQPNTSSTTSSMQLTYDSAEGSTSAAAFETSSMPSGISSAGTQTSSTLSGPLHQRRQTSIGSTSKHRPKNEDLASGVLPDVLMTMREKLESLSLFDSDMMKLAQPVSGFYNTGINGKGPFEEETEEERLAKESLQRSFQQSISAAVLVSLAHKRYERRRLAAMEVEKIVRSLVAQNELERVRAILLLLSDDYVRSTSEDARKGGVVALAACEIGLKKADENNPSVMACKDLILASVVHACQDPNQRVRYYATESLFNVIKVIPTLAVEHFFILFEILRSLYADVDLDVRSGAQLLDKKLKEIIVGAINGGTFHVERCIPLFVRYIYMKNKQTKRLTLTWLQEFSEKLVGNPLLEFVHLFLGGVFAMIADPSSSIRQLALGFLQTILPKLLVSDDDELFEDGNSSFHKLDFDKILQSLVTIMEHPDPFVRKVAMYWTNQIVSAHMSFPVADSPGIPGGSDDLSKRSCSTHSPSMASVSVRNSLPHVLPGILLSIGDAYHSRSTTRDAYFFASQTTHSLAEDTNQCLQTVVKRDGKAFVSHLEGFIVTLLEELDTPGGLGSRNTQSTERKPYRMDVKQDGTGIETTGWFRTSAADVKKSMTSDQKESVVSNSGNEESMMILSRLCALQWIAVLYEFVVPCKIKPDFAREFISPILHQLVHNPPDVIIFKSFEVLAKITIPLSTETLAAEEKEASDSVSRINSDSSSSRFDSNIDVFNDSHEHLRSRDRSVFAVLIRIYSRHPRLLSELTKVIQFMCTLQPPEFVFVSFAIEVDVFVNELCEKRIQANGKNLSKVDAVSKKFPRSKDLDFISSFVQQMNVVFLVSKETQELRNSLKDVIGRHKYVHHDAFLKKKQQLFHILLHSFAHNLVSAVSFCLWGGAYLTASLSLHQIEAMDINLLFFLEVDQLIELLERPLLRHVYLRMLESDAESNDEGSGAMLLHALKSLLMLLPQSTSFNVLKDRLLSVSKYRQNSMGCGKRQNIRVKGTLTEEFVLRLKEVRHMHNTAKWDAIRSESLEEEMKFNNDFVAEKKTAAEGNDDLKKEGAEGLIANLRRPVANRNINHHAQLNVLTKDEHQPLKRHRRTSSQGVGDSEPSNKWRDYWNDVGK